MNRTIDLNCDLGESDARIRDGTDVALLNVVTSANIACGGHAGDEFTMTELVRAAHARGVRIGAHPSYPDRAGFGRMALDISPKAIEAAVFGQSAALAQIVKTTGARLRHVKPHGALYHAAMTSPSVAAAVARAAGRVDRDLVLVGLAGAPALETWRAMGFRVAAEAFADRRYDAGGTLLPRANPLALITDPGEAAEQARSIAAGEGAIAFDGSVVPIRADTICVHGDAPGALQVARLVRVGLEQMGVVMRAKRL